MTSRKIIMVFIAFVVAILSFVAGQVEGLNIDPLAVGATLTAVVTYLYGEFRQDMERVKKKIFQSQKWKDKKFWIALFGALIPPIAGAIGIEINQTILNTIVGIVVPVITGWLFKKEATKSLAA